VAATPASSARSFSPRRADDTTPGQQCRIRVWFHDHRPLAYRAERAAAHRFAEAIRGFGATVAIDGHVTSDLRPLPCERLWAG
jgi:hypothetical protein